MNLSIGLGVATSYLPIPAVALDPDAVIAALFSSGEEGAWYDPSDSSTVWQDAAGTTPAGVGDPVGRIDDKSGNGNHATQSTSAARPVLQSSGGLYYLDFDGVDDYLASPNHPFTYTGDISFYSGFQATVFQLNSTLFSAGSQNNFPANSRSLMGFNCTGHVAPPSFATDIWYPAGVYASTNSPLSTGTDYVAGFVINNWSTHRTSGVTSTINGASQTIVAYGAVDPIALNAGPMCIGVLDTVLTNSFFNFNMYGMVVIDRTLTAGEISDLESYLATKSGVTL